MTASTPSNSATFDFHAFYRDLPRRYLGSGALITDDADRILVVEPVYKETWEIPGGLVDAGEAPRAACARELREELGLVIVPGRLLVMDHQTLPPPRFDSIMFVYDGGLLTDAATITLQPDELRSFRFLPADDLESVLNPRLAGRMREALRARHEGILIERNNGEIIA
ncbi:MAG: NUDIX hydrolase [Thermomicrobiales bacterium]